MVAALSVLEEEPHRIKQLQAVKDMVPKALPAAKLQFVAKITKEISSSQPKLDQVGALVMGLKQRHHFECMK